MMTLDPITEQNAKTDTSKLVRHVVLILILKAVLLAALWYVFIKPNKVTVSVEAMGSHIAGTPSPAHSHTPNPPGENK